MTWNKEQCGYEMPEDCGCNCGYENSYGEDFNEGFNTGYNNDHNVGMGDEVIPAYSYTYRVPACKEYRRTIFVKKCRKVYTYYKPAGSCVTPGRCYEIGSKGQGCGSYSNNYGGHSYGGNSYGGNNCC